MDDLETRLGRMCSLLDDLSADTAVMVELEHTAAPAAPIDEFDLAADSPDGRPHQRRRWAAAVAAVVLVGGGAWLLDLPWTGSTPSERRPAAPPAATTSTSRAAPTDVCAKALETEQAFYERHDVAPHIPTTGGFDTVELDVASDQAARQVLMFNRDWVFRCFVDLDATTGASIASGMVAPVLLSPRSQVAPPGPSEITVDQRFSHSSTMEGNVGPGTVGIVGRVGLGVAAVVAVLPDGTRLEGAVGDGWYAIRGDVPDGVALGEDRLEWTLRSGSESSSRVDLLDATIYEEQCARIAGCIDARLEELHQAALDDARNEQAAILADRIVTTDERQQALQRYADCLNDNGVPASRNGSTLTVTPALDMTDEARWAIEEDCAQEHNTFVEQARTLLDAQRRIDEG